MGVVKSLTRKSPSFRQLAEYVTDPEKALKTIDGQPFIFKHNLSGNSVDEFVKAFKECENNRTSDRKGSVKMYHEFLSWHAKDKDKITPEVAEAIARKYAELRNPNGIYLGGVHDDTDSRHMHLMISGVEAISGKSMRISQEHFEKNVKKELQNYEIEHFGLMHSEVAHGKNSMRKNDAEYQLEKQTGKPSRKEEIKSILEKSFGDSSTEKEFYDNLRENGLTTYERGGKIAGIDDGRHYRLATLGFDKERLSELEVRAERLDEMREMRGIKTNDIEKEFEVSESEGEELIVDFVDEDVVESEEMIDDGEKEEALER